MKIKKKKSDQWNRIERQKQTHACVELGSHPSGRGRRGHTGQQCGVVCGVVGAGGRGTKGVKSGNIFFNIINNQIQLKKEKNRFYSKIHKILLISLMF